LLGNCNRKTPWYGKIAGFRWRFSQQNQSIDRRVEPPQHEASLEEHMKKISDHGLLGRQISVIKCSPWCLRVKHQVPWSCILVINYSIWIYVTLHSIHFRDGIGEVEVFKLCLLMRWRHDIVSFETWKQTIPWYIIIFQIQTYSFGVKDISHFERNPCDNRVIWV
jgi:hypothetical protein